jgi:hypothetical protein
VTLVHLSCSGARVTDLVGADDQLDMASTATGDRQVDLLLVGVGGNDMELNTILGRLCPRQSRCDKAEPPSNVDGTIRAFCATTGAFDDRIDRLFGGDGAAQACVELYTSKLDVLKDKGIVVDAPVDTSARAWFDDLVAGTAPSGLCDSSYSAADLHNAGLALRYDCLAADITKRFGDRVDPARVVVWEYIDVAHTDDGSLCPPGIPEGSGNQSARSLPGFNSAEIRFLDDVFETVNGHIAAAAQRHGWTLIETNPGSRRHGLCASANWIARVDQWLFNAPGASTIAHPTIDGMNYLGETLAKGALGILAG